MLAPKTFIMQLTKEKLLQECMCLCGKPRQSSPQTKHNTDIQIVFLLLISWKNISNNFIYRFLQA